ncbi:SulP family inorganic anion transporter [Glycomyces paridis]|uniref:SulP family inorganic anion transporter n=1 Tax=Glycomyces paridis TaxID=2126555 RepID=A0A4S8PRK4_9ACTN|nr:SulP family inorganic anion transporter [Glycomyces paridis]THV30844.1 SulP family inorganic anion transporter [Glycomyces paridis]
MTPGRPLRRWTRSLGRPKRADAVSGLVTGLFSIPEGMAYAAIGGFPPATGLYSGMVPTIMGALFTRTTLMITTLTSAIALSSQSVLADAGLDGDDAGALATLTILVGVVMLAFGLLKLGSVMSYVSTAVMTGFTTGIALQIVVGVLGDATGYDPQAHNKIAAVGEWLAHLADWDPATVAVAAATIAVWAAAYLVRRLRPLALLIALLVGTVGVALLGLDVDGVGDIAAVPSGFPTPVLPDLDALPHLLTGAVAVALVALAQAAGISTAVPNPDGSRTSASGDFTAQGLANVAGGFFQALPAGGSLSRTGVATGAGAATRWAGIFAGLWLIAIVLAAGRYAEYIPMAVIGGLLILIGGELIRGQVAHIALVWRASKLSAAAMILTFLATTQIPLQQAIFLGAGLSILFYCVQAARSARLVAVVEDGRGDWRLTDPPETLPPGKVTVLNYDGGGFFAELGAINQTWPDTREARDAVLVLRLRRVPDIPSASVLKALGDRAEELRRAGGRLIIAGVDERLMKVFDLTGAADRIGRENLLAARPELFASVKDAVAAGHEWIERRREGESP